MIAKQNGVVHYEAIRNYVDQVIDADLDHQVIDMLFELKRIYYKKKIDMIGVKCPKLFVLGMGETIKFLESGYNHN